MAEHNSFITDGETQKQLADVLLQHARINKERRPGLSQGEMASAINTSRKAVNDSLIALQEGGLVRIDRNRIIINKKVLESFTATK